jgi:hypothetical protein
MYFFTMYCKSMDYSKIAPNKIKITSKNLNPLKALNDPKRRNSGIWGNSTGLFFKFTKYFATEL